MLELVVLFLLSSVTFFCAHLESPTTNWAYFYASCPIVMGLLSAGLVYINVGFASVQYEYIKYFIFFPHRNRNRRHKELFEKDDFISAKCSNKNVLNYLKTTNNYDDLAWEQIAIRKPMRARVIRTFYSYD